VYKRQIYYNITFMRFSSALDTKVDCLKFLLRLVVLEVSM
jgi:hypothetical protein